MSSSYYGRPVVKPHPWQWYVPLYFWIGGMAGASGVLTVVARASGRPSLARVARYAALAGAATSPVLLIADLGRPERFLNMLRVFKPTSPMSVGTWILISFSGCVGLGVMGDLLGVEALAVAGDAGAASFGAPLVAYTAVLIADTATPVWYAARHDLPFVFVASGISAAGAVASLLASDADAVLPRRLMTGGALALVATAEVMHHRLGPLAEPYGKGTSGTLNVIANACAVAGAAIGVLSRGRPGLDRLAAVFVIAAGVCERFSITAAGHESARDPKYTVGPQRAGASEAAA